MQHAGAGKAARCHLGKNSDYTREYISWLEPCAERKLGRLSDPGLLHGPVPRSPSHVTHKAPSRYLPSFYPHAITLSLTLVCFRRVEGCLLCLVPFVPPPLESAAAPETPLLLLPPPSRLLSARFITSLPSRRIRTAALHLRPACVRSTLRRCTSAGSKSQVGCCCCGRFVSTIDAAEPLVIETVLRHFFLQKRTHLLFVAHKTVGAHQA